MQKVLSVSFVFGGSVFSGGHKFCGKDRAETEMGQIQLNVGMSGDH